MQTVDIAIMMDADGVHVGQSDMEAGNVRAKLGPDKIIGVSAQTVEQAVLAQQRGADYLGVGAVFPTGSKDDAVEVSHETLKAICEAVSIPVIAIGGISSENVKELVHNPHILHTNGKSKLPDYGYRYFFADEYRRYLDMTSWRDRKPKDKKLKGLLRKYHAKAVIKIIDSLRK